MALFGSKVSNFMDGMKIDRDISDLETKKNALVSSVRNEKNALQANVTGKFAEIGSKIYEMSLSGGFVDEAFAEVFKEITELKEQIVGKDEKINDISGRYDEEITLLKNLSASKAAEAAPAAAAAAAPAGPPPAGFCPSCGAPHAEGDVFCGNCGGKIQ